MVDTVEDKSEIFIEEIRSKTNNAKKIIEELSNITLREFKINKKHVRKGDVLDSTEEYHILFNDIASDFLHFYDSGINANDSLERVKTLHLQEAVVESKTNNSKHYATKNSPIVNIIPINDEMSNVSMKDEAKKKIIENMRATYPSLSKYNDDKVLKTAYASMIKNSPWLTGFVRSMQSA